MPLKWLISKGHNSEQGEYIELKTTSEFKGNLLAFGLFFLSKKSPDCCFFLMTSITSVSSISDGEWLISGQIIEFAEETIL